jgi:hypothetical protein
MPEHQPVSSLGNCPVAVINDLRIGSADTDDATAYQNRAIAERRIGYVNDTSRAGFPGTTPIARTNDPASD